MKLHDISKFASKSDIRPELQAIHIVKDAKKNTLTTTVTDSYRLATITYDLDQFPLLVSIEPGLYEARAWKELCAKWNKVLAKDAQKAEAVEYFTRFKMKMDITRYPDVKPVFEKIDKADGTIFEGIMRRYNADFVIEHIKLAVSIEGDNYNHSFDFTKMRCVVNDMLEYKTDNARLILMPLLK